MRRAMIRTIVEKVYLSFKMLIFIILIFMGFCIFFVLKFIIGVVMIMLPAILEDQAKYNKKLENSYKYDQQYFVGITEPVLRFSREHSLIGGNQVFVYKIDQEQKEMYLKKYKKQINNNFSSKPECVKETIKKRWGVHYVVPATGYGHDDYLNHDSFRVQGSEKYLPDAVRACQSSFFYLDIDEVSHDQDRYFFHNYWAISRTENLLFSVYATRN